LHTVNKDYDKISYPQLVFLPPETEVSIKTTWSRTNPQLCFYSQTPC